MLPALTSPWASQGLRAARARSRQHWRTAAGTPRTQLRSYSNRSRRLLAYSISQGPEQPPLLPHTIPEHFARVVSENGDRPAVICRDPTTTTVAGQETTLGYAALDALSNSLATSLRSAGVSKGDRVAVKLGNTVEHAALTYAIFKLGGVLVPLNPTFNASQVAAALSHLGVEVFITAAVTDRAYKPCQGRSNLDLLRTLIPDLQSGRVQSELVPTLRKVVVVDNTASHPAVDFRLASHRSLTPYTELAPSLSSLSLSSTRPVVPDSPLSVEDCINIQFTSGTTSQPKAAMLTHTGILNNGYLIGRRMGLTASDLIVCPPPLFHCFGCVLGYMATVTSGAAILFPSPAFDPLASLKMAADHRATGLYGVATMFVSMLEQLDKKAGFSPQEAARLPTHLRKGIAAGSSVPESLMRKLHDRLGLSELVICYGMTETSPVSCMTAPSDPLDKRTATIGRVMPHTRVKIVDPADRTKVVRVGERGELATSGYLVMQGYWGDEEKTKEVRILEPDVDTGRLGRSGRSGRSDATGEPAVVQSSGNGETGPGRWWMYSGDEASMTADGYLSITGRIKDLIIRGGENIHPLEIENALFQHPLIAEASVVGVPDARHGEAVCAFIVPRAGVATEDDPTFGEDGFARSESQGLPLLRKDDVRAWVRGRLSSHLVPKYVFWTDDYPKTASGKIQKYKLRDAARDLIHIHTGPGNVDEKYEAVLEKQIGAQASGQPSWER
ncbi:short-chain-fatty-acid-CoA ligase [Diaporthe helianthi]|uniref:Short-chain-fatty-acid-CoA ligase n=1 Tax=Diaporthe helianthi TaxID=158607 RepID=A0A2P5I546_DIAHE|nr:short-chain-fatty-acid-CoA ligase [Diaporthe helianthi]